MRIDRRLRINLISVVLLGILMLGWVVTQVVGSTFFANPLVVTADFADTGGVFTNQEVTYRGVLVGRVGDLELTEDGVSITLLIDSEWRDRIPADLEANVQSKSAVGEQFVNLTPLDDAGDEMLADGEVIEREQTSLPVDFQALLKTLDRVLADVPADQTANLVENLNEGIGDSSDDIRVLLESLGTLSETFADVAPEQKSLLDAATKSGAAFLKTKENFTAAIKAADTVLAGLGDEPEELRAFFAANDRLAREGIAFFTEHRGDLAGGIAELADFTTFQKVNKDELIIKSLKYVPQFLKAVEDASIPWENPDGSRLYRIRIGLITDNVEASWPCKYKVPFEYERFPHQRGERDPFAPTKCEPKNSSATVRSLVNALEQWAAANPLEAFAEIPEVPDVGDVDGRLIWPLRGPITSVFGPRDDRMHEGIDIDGATGSPVIAAAEGTVIRADYYADYGNTVVVDHGDGMATLYAHLSGFAVRAGDVIEQGDVLGLVGCTGSCTGDHLHFEVRINATPVDPLLYLPGGRLYAHSVTREADTSQYDGVSSASGP
ncbi:MAG: MCE family protein [Actinobacteria bacterium]|nr:MCE family protein [Actinomycetota bacterium]